MKKADAQEIGSYDAALQTTVSAIAPLPAETLPLCELVGRVTAGEVRTLVNSPSLDVSLKDGYAVRSADVADASPERPVTLSVIGDLAAGGSFSGTVEPGSAVRILSGAPLPQGTEAVLAGEFATVRGSHILATADAAPGRNVMRRGDDVRRGQVVVSAGTRIRPAQVGLLAAAGCRRGNGVLTMHPSSSPSWPLAGPVLLSLSFGGYTKKALQVALLPDSVDNLDRTRVG